MPRYRNDGPNGQTVLNVDGKLIQLQTGQSEDTYNFYTTPGFVQVSEEPLFNRVVNRQTITLGAAQDVAISLKTAWILIIQITGAVTVYRQAASNTPPELEDHTSIDPVIQIPAKGTLNNLVMSGTGTCEVIEYTEDLTC